MLGNFCKEYGLLFIVDAISSFIADEIDMREMGIDVLIISSQKALALAPGISNVILSPKMCIRDSDNGVERLHFYLSSLADILSLKELIEQCADRPFVVDCRCV